MGKNGDRFIGSEPGLKTKLIGAVAGCTAVVLAGVLVTMAWLTAQTNDKTNVFAADTVPTYTNTDISEASTEYSATVTSDDGVYTYSVSDKEVVVTNAAAEDESNYSSGEYAKKAVFVRVKATVYGTSDSTAESAVSEALDGSVENLSGEELIDLEIDNETSSLGDYWIYNEADGYYYYQYALYPGYETTALFEDGTIYFTATTEKYSEFHVTFTADTVQAQAADAVTSAEWAKYAAIDTSYATTAWGSSFSDLLVGTTAAEDQISGAGWYKEDNGSYAVNSDFEPASNVAITGSSS